jgi:hypothetical protein
VFEYDERDLKIAWLCKTENVSLSSKAAGGNLQS